MDLLQLFCRFLHVWASTLFFYSLAHVLQWWIEDTLKKDVFIYPICHRGAMESPPASISSISGKATPTVHWSTLGTLYSLHQPTILCTECLVKFRKNFLTFLWTCLCTKVSFCHFQLRTLKCLYFQHRNHPAFGFRRFWLYSASEQWQQRIWLHFRTCKSL